MKEMYQLQQKGAAGTYMGPPGQQVPSHKGLQHTALAGRLAPYDSHLRKLQVEVQLYLCSGGKACLEYSSGAGSEGSGGTRGSLFVNDSDVRLSSCTPAL